MPKPHHRSPSDRSSAVPSTTPGPDREAVVRAGHRGDLGRVVEALTATDPPVRGAALGALVRIASLDRVDPDLLTSALVHGLQDVDPDVRRRAAAEVARWATSVAGRADAPPDAAVRQLVAGLLDRLGPEEADVVTEVATFACGELELDDETRARVVAALDRQARTHPDSLCRESAVAALGSIGDPAGLAGVLHGCSDRATVRRRAVLALAAFDDPEAAAALQRLAEDRDLQVRQSAEELLAIESGEST